MTDVTTYMAQATEWPYSEGDPSGLPASAGNGPDMLKDALLGLLQDNLEWFFALLFLYMAIPFGRALISWYRNRKEPQQGGL